MALNRDSSIIQNDLAQIIEQIPSKLWERLEGRRIIVTGSNGFIGSWFAPLFARVNQEVLKSPCQLVTVDLADNPDEEASEHHKHITFDVTSEWSDIPPAEFVIFAAGIASPTAYRQKPLATINVTVDGLRNAFSHALQHGGLESILYMSTSEIYGTPPPEAIPTGEEYIGKIQTMGPRACYDESKRLGETLSYVYHKHEELPVKVVRPFNVFGPGMVPEDGRVLPDFLKDALAGRAPTLLSDGKPTRTFCYASDAIVAILLVLLSGKDGEVYNIGADTGEISMLELAKIFSALIGKEDSYEFAESEDSDYLVDNPHRRRPDLKKIMTELNYSASVPLEEGIKRYYQYYSSDA